MGLLDWMRSPKPQLRSDAEIRSLADAIPSNGSQFGGSDAGVVVSERTALQHMAVYACVRLLADSVSGLPQDVVRKSRAGVRTPIEPTPPVIGDPNPETTATEHMHQVLTSLALRGNSFEVITAFDKLERPLARIAVHPDDVQVKRLKDGTREYKVAGEKVPAYEIIHIRRLSLPGSPMGLSPIEQARQGIGLSLAAERYGARFFGDSANPSSVLESDANINETERIKVMTSWVQTHGGRRAPAMLTGGLKYRPISITPEESQFLQTRSFQRGEIAMMFGVPPHMIGDTDKATSWGSGIEQQSIGFVQYTLLPWLRVIEDAYTKFLLPRGQYMKFNVSGLLRGDTTQRYGAYAQALNAGWMNANEVRALEDQPPFDGGDAYLRPMNMAPAASGDEPMPATEVVARVNAAGTLIRSGFEPQAALTASGLNPVNHLGLLPVTVQKPVDPEGAVDQDVIDEIGDVDEGDPDAQN